jgi:hypothetical protein
MINAAIARLLKPEPLWRYYGGNNKLLKSISFSTCKVCPERMAATSGSLNAWLPGGPSNAGLTQLLLAMHINLPQVFLNS